MLLFRKQIAQGWKALHTDLLALAQHSNKTGNLERGKRGVVSTTDLYQVFGGHRIWFEAAEWKNFVQLIPSPSPSSMPNTVDICPLVEEIGVVLSQPGCTTGWNSTEGDNTFEILDLCDNDDPPATWTKRGDNSPADDRAVDGRMFSNVISGVLVKQLEANSSLVVEALSTATSISIFKVSGSNLKHSSACDRH